MCTLFQLILSRLSPTFPDNLFFQKNIAPKFSSSVSTVDTCCKAYQLLKDIGNSIAAIEGESVHAPKSTDIGHSFAILEGESVHTCKRNDVGHSIAATEGESVHASKCADVGRSFVVIDD